MIKDDTFGIQSSSILFIWPIHFNLFILIKDRSLQIYFLTLYYNFCSKDPSMNLSFKIANFVAISKFMVHPSEQYLRMGLIEVLGILILAFLDDI